MKNLNCLSEQDLTLHYYGEIPPDSPELQHLGNCPLCQKRFAALRQNLDALPSLSQPADPAAGTRMAARVRERLHRRRRNWVPALGAASVAVFALVVSIVTWSPQGQQMQTVQSSPPHEVLSLHEDMPDIDFLEDLELLKELELLSQIEGV